MNFVADAAILFLTNILFFWNILFVNKFNIFYRDYIYAFVQHDYTATLLKQGHFPLWDPFYYGPFVALQMPAVFYPFNIICDFLMGKVGDLNSSFYIFQYNQIFHFFLGSFFMYLLMRKVGLKRLSSLFAGIVFVYSGRLVGDLINPYRVNGSIWLPLILLFLIEANQQKKIFYSIIAGIFLGFTFLSGSLQIALFISLALILYSFYCSYGLYRLAQTIKSSLVPLVNCFIVHLIAFGISAIQMIPTFEYVLLTGRVHPDFDTILSLGNVSPAYLIHLLIPNFFILKSETFWWGGNLAHVGPWEVNFYTGIITLILATFAILSPKRKFINYLFMLLLLSIFLILGKFVILSGWLFLLPGFGNVRIPARYALFTSFSIAALSGIGINVFLNPLSGNQKKLFNLIYKFFVKFFKSFIFISLPIFYLVLFLSGANKDYSRMIIITKAILFFIIFYLIGVLFLIMRTKINRQRWIVFTVVFIALIDLFIFQRSFNPIVEPTTLNDWTARGKVITFLKNEKDIFRVYGRNFNQWYAFYQRIFTKGYGYEGSFGIARRVKFEDMAFEDINSSLLDLYNVKYIIDDEKYPENFTSKFRKVSEIPNLYENLDVMPRVFIIHQYKVIENETDVLEELQRFNPRDYIILEEEPHLVKRRDINPVTISRVVVKKYSFSNIEIRVSTDSDGFLFISDVWYPGWKVYIDGIKHKIYRANYTFTAVELKKGEHEVNFRYDPISFKIGAGITLFTILLLSIIFLSSFSRKRENV